MRVGVLDVGSNTARLLVADVGHDRNVVAVATESVHLGLGAEIAESGTLRAKTIVTTAAVCRRYAKRARGLGATRAEIIVTAPGRQGAAASSFVARLSDETRLPVRILSADEEGELAYRGAVSRLDRASRGLVGVVDVGGGSTEIVVGRAPAGPSWIGSVDLGSLRLTRLALPGDPPSKRQLAAARELVSEALATLRPPEPAVALAAGGSARALAKLVGRRLDPETVEPAISLLARRPARKVARASGIGLPRAGTLLAGALILGEVSRSLERSLVLARGGLREGAALALAAPERDIIAA
jgi:exopolyphosphatase / guanosine-5'-triphosphate,3'-diphosphate pyrophosphatase